MDGERTNRQALVRAVCRNVGNTFADLIEHGGWELETPEGEVASLSLQEVGPTEFLLILASDSSTDQIRVRFEYATQQWRERRTDVPDQADPL